MKGLTLLLLVAAASADLNGFKPMFAPPQNIDRQGTSYSTSIHHPASDPDRHAPESIIDVTFGSSSPQQQQQQESRVSNVFNKNHYIPPKTIESYQKPLQYQNQGGVLTAKTPDSQLFNVGYSVSFADAKKNIKKSVYRQPDGDVITGTRKAQETVQKPTQFEWKQNSPAVEVIKSDELSVNGASNVYSQQPQQFDHANALGRSIGFDYSNAMEGGSPIYKKYVRPGGTLEKKAEHYFSKQPLRIVHLQTAASGAVPSYEKAGEGQSSQLGRYEPPSAKLPIDTRLLRNPVLLTAAETATNNYKPDPNVIPIHFDTRQLQETVQNEHQQQPFAFPDYSQQLYQQGAMRSQQHFQEADQQPSLRAFTGKAYPVEKRGGLKKELAPRQPRYTPKVQIQTHLRPPPQVYQRKVLVAKLH